jgi:succinate dehydrogenase / fumarate reductase cytochrome b subunit
MQPSSRPVFLDLVCIRLPLPGILSIAHRLSGLLLFLALPLLAALLDLVLSGEAGYRRAWELIHALPGRLLFLLLLWALMHHLLAGFRYLFIDADLGVRAPRYRQSARAVLLGAPLLALLLWWGLL